MTYPRPGRLAARYGAAMPTGEDLRGLMRYWPHGVSVLSVDHEGDSMGVTLSSLVSLSLDPPLVGVSVGKQASCYELLRRAGAFAVSLLGAEFAGPGAGGPPAPFPRRPAADRPLGRRRRPPGQGRAARRGRRRLDR